MPYYIYAWIASISSGLILIITKLTSKYSIKNVWLFNFLWSLISLLFIIPPSLLNQARLPQDWTPIILAGLFSTLWYVFYIISIYLLDVTTISPLFNFRTIFAILIGFLFLGESFTSYQVILMGLVIVMGVFATMDEKFSIKSFFKPSIGLALLAMLFLAINNAYIKLSLVNNSLWTTSLWEKIFNLIFLLPTIPLFCKDLLKIKLKQVLPVGLMGVFQVITSVTVNIAYGVNVGITSVIMSLPFSMILAILFSVFAPKLLEKHSLKVYAVRLTAALIMIYGAFQLSH